MSENTAPVTAVEIEDVEGTEETVTFQDILDELVTEATYSPYQVAGIVNKVYAIVGVTKVIPPQMMYIYNSKGYLGEKGNKTVTQEQVLEFLNKKATKWFQQ
jgi:hypothetical protein